MKEKLFDYKNFIHLFQGFLLVIYLIDQTLLQKTTEFYLFLLGILLLVEASKVRFNHMMVTKGVAIMGIVLVAYKTRGAGVKAFAFCLLLSALFYVIITYQTKNSTDGSRQ